MVDRKKIREAYRKFKSFVYYDNTSLLLRKQLAEFETSEGFEGKLDRLADELSDYIDIDTEYWSDMFNEIKYWSFVKDFKKDGAELGIITNSEQENTFAADRFTYLINAPIELHIISALWAMNVGYKLETKLSIRPYGNKIELEKYNDESVPVSGLRFYRAYFKEYQKWRDGAINAAKELIDKNKDALLIGLDIKNYYHSVRISESDISSAYDGVTTLDEKLTNLLFTIQKKYTRLVPFEELSRPRGKNCILPIGLMSSGILSNWYLRELDDVISRKLRPEFYGRYVDDILIVVSAPTDLEIKSLESVTKQYFIDTDIFVQNLEQAKSYKVLPETYKEIEIQESKLSIMHFVHTEPTAVLDKFAKEVRKISSEYRFLPEEELIEDDFDESAYSLEYSGSKNKLRSVKEFSEDKFGISKFLAKKIFLTLQSDHKQDKDTAKKILRFFRYKKAIELAGVWEKVATYFVINNEPASLISFIKAIVAAIENIIVDNDKTRKRVVRDYIDFLIVAIELSVSLRPKILTETFKNKLTYVLRDYCTKESFNLDLSINYFRLSNLIRHGYVIHPLLNYSKHSTSEEPVDLVVHTEYFRNRDDKTLDIDPAMFKYSPRFVHFHEITLFHLFKRVSRIGKSPLGIGVTSKGVFEQDYLNDAIDDYYRFNFKRTSTLNKKDKKDIDSLKEQIVNVESESVKGKKNSLHRTLVVEDGNHKSSLSVALANIKMTGESFTHEYLRKPIVSEKRKRDINKVLNLAEDEKVDLMVLPEASIPVRWMKWMTDQAKRHQRAMVFGLEHWIVNNYAYNFIVTLLPVRLKGFDGLVISFRLKNHYSPEEERKLVGYGYKIPTLIKPYYDHIKWRNNWFAVFNCYELTNIHHRASFKSKVDFMVACEYNKDVNYFSNIVESSSRDIHCYFIQSNNAIYGDNRITQPSSTIDKDILKIKGGDNPTILVEKIDIKALREFQLKNYELQKDIGIFKPTPPDFDKKLVMERVRGYKGK